MNTSVMHFNELRCCTFVRASVYAFNTFFIRAFFETIHEKKYISYDNIVARIARLMLGGHHQLVTTR